MTSASPRKPVLFGCGQDPVRSPEVTVHAHGPLAGNAFGLLIWLRFKEKRKERLRRQERERQRRIYWGYE